MVVRDFHRGIWAVDTVGSLPLGMLWGRWDYVTDSRRDFEPGCFDNIVPAVP